MSEQEVDGRKLIVESKSLAEGTHIARSTLDAPRPWHRFRRNRPALASAWFLAAIVLIVVAWPVCLKVAARFGSSGLTFSQRYQPDKVSEEQFLGPSLR